MTNVQEPQRTDAFWRKRLPGPIEVICTMDGSGGDSSTLDTGFRLWVPPCRIKKPSTWENGTFLLIEIEQEQWGDFPPEKYTATVGAQS
jgi:hypothetical protein